MTKRILLLIFFICITIPFFAQTSRENQFNEIIKNISLTSAGDPEIKKIENIVKTCKSSNYRKCEGLGYLKMALIYLKNNNTAKAIYYSDKIDEEQLITANTDVEFFFHLKTLQCNILQYSHENLAALQKLKEIPENLVGEYPYFTYSVLLLSGNIYSDLTNYTQAMQCYKKAYRISKRCREEKNIRKLDIKRENQISNSYKATTYLAEGFLIANQIDSAKFYIKEALNNLKKLDDIKDADVKIAVHYTAGSIYMKEGDYFNAQKNYLVSKKISDRYFPVEMVQKEIYSALFHLYEKMGKTDSVHYYSKKIIETGEKNEAKNIGVKKAIDNKRIKIKSELLNNNKKLIYLLSAILLLCLLLIFITINFYKKYKSRIADKKDIPINLKVIEKTDNRSNKSFEEIVILAKENKPQFLTRFNEFYPDFTNRLLNVNNKIQNSEIRFCALLYLNFSTKEIAEFTHISVRTVQTKKYNLRKKLNIPTDVDTYLWFSDLMR